MSMIAPGVADVPVWDTAALAARIRLMEDRTCRVLAINEKSAAELARIMRRIKANDTAALQDEFIRFAEFGAAVLRIVTGADDDTGLEIEPFARLSLSEPGHAS